MPQTDRCFENLDDDWQGGCVTFFRFTFRAAGRPHCVNTCPCARPTSSVLISIACLHRWAWLIQKLVPLIVGPLLYGLVSLTAGSLT